MADPGAAEDSDDTDDDPRRSGRILDAAALKALAHPLRFQLLELLIEEGPATASGLGRRVGESSGSTSYHLRRLAREGLIEEVSELGTARDRWWRAVKGGWTLDGFEFLERPGTRDDASMLLDELVQARVDRLRRWHRDGPRWGPEWVTAALENTGRLRLTRDQFDALTRELTEVTQRFREQQAAPDDPDAVTVGIQLDAFPIGEPPDATAT